MSILDAVRGFFHDVRGTEQERRKEEEIRRAFKARCAHFKTLLSANKHTLSDMASLEEALKGERLFGMSFVRARCTLIIAGVFNMARHLNALSDNAYPELFERIKAIQQEISGIVSPREEFFSGPLVLPLNSVDYSMADEVGAKMAGLGEAVKKLGRTIPSGFVVTASGYRRFIAANNLQDEINRRIQMTDLSGLDAVFALSSSLQQLIMAAPVPDDLASAILGRYRDLEEQHRGARLAVRSSAIGEDTHGASYAGQYRSNLNVTGDRLLDAYKDVVASKYSVTAMTYRINRGIPDDEVPMCVGCLHMVDAACGGVAYSRDPLNREKGVLINAVPGLPKAVVDGSAEVDVFRVSREEPHEILERRMARKHVRLDGLPGGGVAGVALNESDGAAPSLSDHQVLEVAKAALLFEDFYGTPQDMEWAFDPSGHLVLLQIRPLSGVEFSAKAMPLPEKMELLLEGGVPASSGVGTGEAFIVRRDTDMLHFPERAVLVVEQAHACWAPILDRASAVVSEYGGTAGHLASVAREYGVPALFGVENAVQTLKKGGVITVDADSRRVFKGQAEDRLARKKSHRLIFAESPVFKALERAAKHIVPLNLLDPDSPEFTPANCRTLHDITRFAHEKAVEEMFRMDVSLLEGRFGKQLTYKGNKLQYFIINIENGFCRPIQGNSVALEDICCPPMHALWNGMLAIPWEGPAGTTGRGFWTLVAESAGNPELEIARAPTRMWRNYVMVDRDYCSLQASFGYHFCTIEAQAGEAEQENYVNFHFKGGAANLGRRTQRVQAIADVLAENGFIVEVKEDALLARAEELPASGILELLLVLGYLIIHTRQMDVPLGSEASRAAFADMLRQGIVRVLKTYA